MLIFIALLSGALFGLGLLLSGMMNPEKILGFLDLFGQWDPTLALVMAGALGVFAPGYWWFRRQGRGHCVLGDSLPEVPAARFDRKL
ncbi:hypothetical protein OJHNALOF_02840 [Oceanimonas sp. MB9]|nr:hypothetical protein [Oceanimonas sp. MB9]